MRNLKRIIALAATFALTLTSTAFAANYSDVTDDSVYAEAIETLSKLNIFTGDDQDGDGIMSFRPEDSITRAEFAALIARIQGFEGTAMTQTATIFNDVPSTHWASGYIAQATNQGIVNGYGDGNFGPEDEVKYEEAIKMIMATLGYEPYAKQEGGYPTGYLTAATRYNVTKGVTNTATGVAATRGTIAQLLNNAIDTALMGQAKWSNSGIVEYVIYDGVTQAYKTLMSEYLGVTKLKGKVVANSITDLNSFKSIDTSKEPEVRIDITDNFNTTNDDFQAYGEYDFKVAGTDAEDYLGQSVIFYAKERGSDDTYDIISMVGEAGKNTKVEFSLDKFDSADPDGNVDRAAYIKYMKNDSDRNATKITIEKNAKIIYNNVAGLLDYEDLFVDALIEKDGKLGGKVVAYDTDNETGYDVIFVEVGATGVVDEVVNKKITFKNYVGLSKCENSLSNIVVDEDDDDVIVNITKDGKKIGVDELKEWDVLSIITSSASDVYNIEVLSGANAIEGSISAITSSKTSDTGSAYRINGTKYDVAEGAYKCADSNLKVGNSGVFYIDAYGKIVAYNKDATSTGKVNYNYAYVLGVSDDEDNFGKGSVQFKLLTAKQGVVIWNAASQIKIQEPGEIEKNYKVEDDSKLIASKVPEGSTIAYTMSGNTIKTITLPGYDMEEFQQVKIDTAAEYDKDSLRFGREDVDENTVVLFVDDDDDNSEVGTIADLVDEETYNNAMAFVDDVQYDALSLIVIKDHTNKFGSSSSIAVVSDVYESQNANDEDVYTIEFLMDGEVKTAITTADAYDYIEDITEGDIYKFKFNAAGEIKEAKAYVDFEDGVREKYGSDGLAAAPEYTVTSSVGYDEEIVVAAVKDYKTSTKTITVGDEKYNLSKAKRVYVVDPSRNRMVSVGSVGDVEYDKDVTADNVTSVTDKEGNLLADGGNVEGLLDYVVIRLYDNKVEEVVVVKAYDFGRLSTD